MATNGSYSNVVVKFNEVTCSVTNERDIRAAITALVTTRIRRPIVELSLTIFHNEALSLPPPSLNAFQQLGTTVSNLPGLKKLVLAETVLKDTVDATFPLVEDSLLRSIQNPDVTELDLFIHRKPPCPVDTQQLLVALSGLPSLNILRLCAHVANNEILPATNRLPDVYTYPDFSSLLGGLVDHPHIHTLAINFDFPIGSDGLQRLVTSHPNLRHLKVCGSYGKVKAPFEGLLSALENTTTLESLLFSGRFLEEHHDPFYHRFLSSSLHRLRGIKTIIMNRCNGLWPSVLKGIQKDKTETIPNGSTSFPSVSSFQTIEIQKGITDDELSQLTVALLNMRPSIQLKRLEITLDSNNTNTEILRSFFDVVFGKAGSGKPLWENGRANAIDEFYFDCPSLSSVLDLLLKDYLPYTSTLRHIRFGTLTEEQHWFRLAEVVHQNVILQGVVAGCLRSSSYVNADGHTVLLKIRCIEGIDDYCNSIKYSCQRNQSLQSILSGQHGDETEQQDFAVLLPAMLSRCGTALYPNEVQLDAAYHLVLTNVHLFAN